MLVAVLVLAGCGSLTPVTKEGVEIRDLYNILFIAAAIIFLLVEAAIVFAVVQYRRRSDPPPQFQQPARSRLDGGAAADRGRPVRDLLGGPQPGRGQGRQPPGDGQRARVPVAVAVHYEGERLDLPPGNHSQDLTIKGSIAKPPVMYLPVGEPIRFNTQAQDVIHSFYVRSSCSSGTPSPTTSTPST